MWRLADVFSSLCLCVHRREKADDALISCYFGQHVGSFSNDARVDRLVFRAPSVVLKLQ